MRPWQRNIYTLYWITLKELSIYSFLWCRDVMYENLRGVLTYVCSNPENCVTANKSKCLKCCKCTNPRVFPWNIPTVTELIVQCTPRYSFGTLSYTYVLKKIAAWNVFHFTIDVSIKWKKLHWLWAEKLVNISMTESVNGLCCISAFRCVLLVCSIISFVFKGKPPSPRSIKQEYY